MNEKQLLFLLLKSVLEKETAKLDETPSEETLKKLYSLSKGHDVAHLAAFALEKSGVKMSDELTRKFRKQKLIAMYRYEQIKYDFENICLVLEEMKVPFIPLKGAVIRKLYPEEWMRTSCDIDILVKKEDCEKAESFLCEKLGFTLENGKTLHDYQFMSPTGVLLELHYTLIEDDCLPKAAPFLEKVWESAELCGGYSYKYKMSDELFAMYNVAHTAKHFVHGGCGVKSFVDLYILEHNLQFSREKLNELLEKAGLYSFYEASEKICHIWFENDKYNKTSTDIEKYVLHGGVYGSADNGAAMSAGKGESKLKSFMGNMFLSYDALCVVYPNLKKRKALYPFYQIKRWFRVFKKDKRKKITQLTGIRNSVSDKEQKKAKELLDKLGIE